jgi:hypothetical protein
MRKSKEFKNAACYHTTPGYSADSYQQSLYINTTPPATMSILLAHHHQSPPYVHLLPAFPVIISILSPSTILPTFLSVNPIPSKTPTAAISITTAIPRR